MNKPIVDIPESSLGEERPDVGRESFRVTNAADTTVVELFDDVFPWEAKRLMGEVRASKSKSLELRINSGGGDVFGGIAIYNALARFPGKVRIEVEGIAASIASVIAMAGDEIRMGKGSYLMIHDPHAVAAGGAADMRATADLLDKVRDSLADIYAARTGKKKDRVLEMMAAETWMTADEAVREGFADKLSGQARLAASIQPGRYMNAPKELLARAERTIGADEIKAAIAAIDDEKILRGLASNIGNRIKQLGTPAEAAAPEAKSETEPPEAPPAPAADVQTADTPAEPVASPIEVEAAKVLIDRVLGRDSSVTAA